KASHASSAATKGGSSPPADRPEHKTESAIRPRPTDSSAEPGNNLPPSAGSTLLGVDQLFALPFADRVQGGRASPGAAVNPQGRPANPDNGGTSSASPASAGQAAPSHAPP